jgi:hypothetical protein
VPPGLGRAPMADPVDGGVEPSGLPERRSVHWRRQVDESELRRRARWWTLTTLANSLPFVVAAVALVVARPILAPVSLILLVHAWAIPELYARRGAGVLRRRAAGDALAESRAMLILGDLVGERDRRLHLLTGLVTEVGVLGVWVVGEAGALLIRPGGRRVFAYCVRVTDGELPHGDRIAHLLLALRCDERDFATVANLAFSGAPWRLRRRMAAVQRPALREARELARAQPTQRLGVLQGARRRRSSSPSSSAIATRT